MAQLIYSTVSSLDGFIEDTNGKFIWDEGADDVVGFLNDLERGAGTYLYGRRMYETMAVWETDSSLAAASPIMRDFAEIWQRRDKIVFSSTLREPSTARTRIEQTFDPDVVRHLRTTATSDILISGPTLAAHAFKAGLVDGCHLLLAPVIVGGGKPGLPRDVRLKLKLEDERRFKSGMMFLKYRTMA